MDDLPVNSGGFGDVWRGVYDEQPVAIKGLRVYREGDIREVKRVGCDDLMFLPSFTSLVRCFARRLLCGSGCHTPTLSHSWGFAIPPLHSLWYRSGCRTAMYGNTS